MFSIGKRRQMKKVGGKNHYIGQFRVARRTNLHEHSHMQMRLLAHEIQPFYGNSTAGGDRGKVHFAYEMMIMFKKYQIG